MGTWVRILLEVLVPLRFGTLAKFCLYPTLPVSFEGETKRRRSLLSGVYARGSKGPTRTGECVMVNGLFWTLECTNLRAYNI